MADTTEITSAPGHSSVPVVWGNVPPRNKNFTGRDVLLHQLRQRLTDQVTAVLPHSLHGMGGVGKTQLAIEYAYRYQSDYQLIWWISADQEPLVRSSLAALAPRLGVGDVTPGRVDEAVRTVFEALRRGEPYDRWLLIFDNADQPDDLLRFIPNGPGHVIVTSRNYLWERASDVLEVDVFTRDESIGFLRRRVPGISDADADRLADELGDLPLGLEQAGALQAETGMRVEEYLDLLAQEAGRVLAESHPTDYPVPVAAAWSLSMARLKEQMPFAWELLRRCAFFGPEPIPRDLLKNGRFVLEPPLRTMLGDTIELSRATRELGRYALAKVDANHNTLQLHRLIQRLIRDDMTVDEAAVVRADVHRLLEAGDPDDPDNVQSWDAYTLLLPHIVPSEATVSTDPKVRKLVSNVVSYLLNVGDLDACDRLSSEALERWAADSSPDDTDVLVLAGHRADLLWTRGAYPEAYELRLDTLERMRATLRENHEHTLRVNNGHGADLRVKGDFTGALALDEDMLGRYQNVFGPEHPDTFNVANNLAVDLGLNGRYDEARQRDNQTYDDRLVVYGRDDDPRLLHTLSSVGRDLWQGGRCREGLETEERAYKAFSALVSQRVLPATHPWVLQQAKELSVARRKMGMLESAHHLAVEVYEKHRDSLGREHPDTLAAAMNVGTAKRALTAVQAQGDPVAAQEPMLEADRQIEQAFVGYRKVLGDDHPYTHGCALNLATARRLVGENESARQLLEDARTGLRERLGDHHHYTLTCVASLATALADLREVEQARELGETAREGLRSLLGDNHPHTLACGSNLAIDLRTLGESARAEPLARDTVERYLEVFPADHFDVTDAVAGKRVAFDFEPAPL